MISIWRVRFKVQFMPVFFLASAFFSHVWMPSTAQQPISAFTSISNSCINQNIYLKNGSTSSTAYSWDFCQGDLSLTPFASNVELLGGNVTTGIDVVYDGSHWFGFVCSRDDNSIFRLDFGIDLYSIPTVTNLGSIGGNINKPIDIKIVAENGLWYGFVYGQEAPNLSRINFGNSLINTSTLTVNILLSGSGSVNGGFDMIYDGANWNVILTYASTLSVIRLTSIDAIPNSTDVITGIVNPYGSSLGDITLKKYNGDYYGFLISSGNKTIQRIDFGPSLFTATPTIDDLSGVLPTSFSLNPFGIDLGEDNGNYYLFISTLEGNLLKINLGINII